MSPRAAWRLETLGFNRVYDYVDGKADWFAAGLPREGEAKPVLRAADIARTDDVTCRLEESAPAAGAKMRAGGKSECIVTNDEMIVLGRLRAMGLTHDRSVTVEDVMESGPTTTRPDTEVGPLVERMRARNVARILVATSGGRLIGTMYRADAEEQLGAPDEEVACDC